MPRAVAQRDYQGVIVRIVFVRPHEKIEYLLIIECGEAGGSFIGIRRIRQAREASNAINEQEEVGHVAIDEARFIQVHKALSCGGSADLAWTCRRGRHECKAGWQIWKLILKPSLRSNSGLVSQGRRVSIESLRERLTTCIVLEEIGN